MIYQKEIEEYAHYDVVVCGGGFSGFAAAYAAAREGAGVLIVERGSCLGGVGTAGLVTDILGARHIRNGVLVDNVKGIFCELERRLLERNAAVDARGINYELHPHGWLPFLAAGLIYDSEVMKKLLEEMLTEAGAELLYLTEAVDVMKSGGRIDGVVIYNKGGLKYVTADCFVDATGDGDVCVFAGCGYELGDERGGMAAASLEMQVDNVDSVELFKYMETTRDLRFRKIIAGLKKRGEWDFPYEIFISVKLCGDDVYLINTIRQVGIDGTNAASLTAGIVGGRRENLRLFEIMRRYFPGFSNAGLRLMAPSIGIRETRRIHGDYTLTVDDLICGRSFRDCIAVSSYQWDLPNPEKPSMQPYENVRRKSVYTYIPYRCLLAEGVDNLMMAGRCISVEREVLGPVRVMGVCLAMGECAGIAAAIASREKRGFREIDVGALRTRITECGGITSMPDNGF